MVVEGVRWGENLWMEIVPFPDEAVEVEEEVHLACLYNKSDM